MKAQLCQEAIAAEPNQAARRADDISPFDLFSILLRRKLTIAKVVLIATAIAAAIAFVIPVTYMAETAILTPQQQQSSLSVMAQLAGGNSGMGLSSLGLLSGMGFKNPADLYVAILGSRTIADALITRFDLKRIYRDKDFYSARKDLARRTTIKTGKDTLIRISVEDRDPKRSAQLANGYVEELSRQNSTEAFTEASQRRLFFEQQLEKEKDKLANAEIAMRDTQQFTGLVAPGGQAEAVLRGVSQLHAEILSREAEVEGMRTLMTDDNPRFQMVKRGLGTLKAALATLEKGEHVAGTPEVPVDKLPQAGLEYIRKFRDVKYHDTLYEILAKQYEAARLDEAKSASQVQVIDKAVVPERKNWPPRGLLIAAVSLFSALVSSFWVILKNDPLRRDL